MLLELTEVYGDNKVKQESLVNIKMMRTQSMQYIDSVIWRPKNLEKYLLYSQHWLLQVPSQSLCDQSVIRPAEMMYFPRETGQEKAI